MLEFHKPLRCPVFVSCQSCSIWQQGSKTLVVFVHVEFGEIWRRGTCKSWIIADHIILRTSSDHESEFLFSEEIVRNVEEIRGTTYAISGKKVRSGCLWNEDRGADGAKTLLRTLIGPSIWLNHHPYGVRSWIFIEFCNDNDIAIQILLTVSSSPISLNQVAALPAITPWQHRNCPVVISTDKCRWPFLFIRSRKAWDLSYSKEWSALLATYSIGQSWLCGETLALVNAHGTDSHTTACGLASGITIQLPKFSIREGNAMISSILSS